MATNTHIPNSINDAIDLYLSHVSPNLSSPSVSAARQSLSLFTQFLSSHYHVNANSTPPHALGVGWFTDFVDYLQNTRSVETEHLYSRALLAFYHHATIHSWSTIDVDICTTYLSTHRRPKHHNIPEPPIAAIDKIVSFLHTWIPAPPTESGTTRDRLRDLRDKAFLLTLTDTGLKVSEICSLRRSSFQRQISAIQVDDDSLLPITSSTTRALSQYLTERQSFDASQNLLPLADLPLFARHDKRAGSKILPISRWTASNITDIFTALALSPDELKQLSLNGQSISPHSFRHYFVINLLSKSQDISLTQAMARHSDPSTTRRYLSSLPNHQDPTDNTDIISADGSEEN